MKVRAGYVSRYTNALQDLKSSSGHCLKVEGFSKHHKITTSFLSACTRMGIVTRHRSATQDGKVYIWTNNFEPTPSTAVQLAKLMAEHQRETSKKRALTTQTSLDVDNADAKRPATASSQKPKPKAQRKKRAPKRAEREQKSISILWGMISIKY